MSHADVTQPTVAVGQQVLGLAVAALHHLLDHQTGEQLGQGEILAAELTGVIREGLAGQLVGGPHHPPW